MATVCPRFGLARKPVEAGGRTPTQCCVLREDEPHPVADLVPRAQLIQHLGVHGLLRVQKSRRVEGGLIHVAFLFGGRASETRWPPLGFSQENHALMRNMHRLDTPAANSMDFMRQYPAERLLAIPQSLPAKTTRLTELARRPRPGRPALVALELFDSGAASVCWMAQWNKSAAHSVSWKKLRSSTGIALVEPLLGEQKFHPCRAMHPIEGHGRAFTAREIQHVDTLKKEGAYARVGSVPTTVLSATVGHAFCHIKLRSTLRLFCPC